MKKFFISILLFVCATLLGCTNEPPPNIENIVYDSGTGVITITLSSENRVDLASVKTMATLTKGGFTGDEIDFTITGAVPGTTYTLSGFNPALQSDEDYYLVFEEGAFGNYGQWSLTGRDDKSDPLVWEFAG